MSQETAVMSRTVTQPCLHLHVSNSALRLHSRPIVLLNQTCRLHLALSSDHSLVFAASQCHVVVLRWHGTKESSLRLLVLEARALSLVVVPPGPGFVGCVLLLWTSPLLESCHSQSCCSSHPVLIICRQYGRSPRTDTWLPTEGLRMVPLLETEHDAKATNW